MKILVTGATGTVGGHVVCYLASQGHEVRTLVRDPAKAGFPADVEVVQGDLTDTEDVHRALEGTPDFVTTSVLETMGEAASVLDPTGAVETLTGQAPRTFRQWADENKEAF